MLEYLLALAAIIAATAALWRLTGVTFSYAERTENLTASDYP